MTVDSPPARNDRDGEHTGVGRIGLWLLLRSDRVVFATGLTAVTFLAVVTGLTVLDPPLLQRAATSDPVETLFGAMITAIITVTTLVVTIGQLVLAQENGPLGHQRDRMRNAMSVRDEVRVLTGSPPAADPAAFLGALLRAARERARALEASLHDPASAHDEGHQAAADPSAAQAFDRTVAAVAAETVENAESVLDRLDGAEFGTFAVVGAMLHFDYDTKLVEIERIQSEYGHRLTPDQCDLLSELEETFSLFATAREHVKTLYFQWTLIDLSRLILSAAIPALVVAAITLGVVTPRTAPGQTLGIDHLVLLVSGAFAVTLVPFTIFIVYVLRVLTIAKRTLAIDPLVLRETGTDDP